MHPCAVKHWLSMVILIFLAHNDLLIHYHCGDNIGQKRQRHEVPISHGLDALMADQEEEEPKGKKEKRKEEDRSRSPRKRESMSEYLKRQVNQHEEAAASGKKKKDERRRKVRKRKPASSDIQSGEGSDSSSFQLTPAQGGSSFGEWPKRNPGN